METTPATLDEFTDMLIQFKEKNPMNVAGRKSGAVGMNIPWRP